MAARRLGAADGSAARRRSRALPELEAAHQRLQLAPPAPPAPAPSTTAPRSAPRSLRHLVHLRHRLVHLLDARCVCSCDAAAISAMMSVTRFTDATISSSVCARLVHQLRRRPRPSAPSPGSAPLISFAAVADCAAPGCAPPPPPPRSRGPARPPAPLPPPRSAPAGWSGTRSRRSTLMMSAIFFDDCVDLAHRVHRLRHHLAALLRHVARRPSPAGSPAARCRRSASPSRSSPPATPPSPPGSRPAPAPRRELLRRRRQLLRGRSGHRGRVAGHLRQRRAHRSIDRLSRRGHLPDLSRVVITLGEVAGPSSPALDRGLDQRGGRMNDRARQQRRPPNGEMTPPQHQGGVAVGPTGACAASRRPCWIGGERGQVSSERAVRAAVVERFGHLPGRAGGASIALLASPCRVLGLSPARRGAFSPAPVEGRHHAAATPDLAACPRFSERCAVLRSCRRMRAAKSCGVRLHLRSRRPR